MAAIDKLHKLYSTTFEPLVWTRSVGVEALNELDSLKAALMVVAGAYKHATHKREAWTLAANGVETLVNSARTANNVSGGIAAKLSAGLHKFLKATATMDNDVNKR
jgi:ubiquinone biosynthesis monooxygenase Coq6